MIYGLGFSLEKIAAMQEHGIKGCSIRSYRLLQYSPKIDSVFQGYMGMSNIIGYIARFTHVP
jgi:hypothetical protein